MPEQRRTTYSPSLDDKTVLLLAFQKRRRTTTTSRALIAYAMKSLGARVSADTDRAALVMIC